MSKTVMSTVWPVSSRPLNETIAGQIEKRVSNVSLRESAIFDVSLLKPYLDMFGWTVRSSIWKCTWTCVFSNVNWKTDHRNNYHIGKHRWLTTRSKREVFNCRSVSSVEWPARGTTPFERSFSITFPTFLRAADVLGFIHDDERHDAARTPGRTWIYVVERR